MLFYLLTLCNSLDFFTRISKTLFSIIKEGGIVKKVRLFVLDFEIKWDSTACLRPAHTKIFDFSSSS